MKLRSLLTSVVIGCMLPAFSLASDLLIDLAEKDWRYLDTKAGPGADWTKVEFDDTKWKRGTALLGYGDEDVQTQISFGDEPQNKHPVVYFRKAIEIKDATRFRKYRGKVICDDGAVVYVNGQEIFRRNMPEGKITNTTRALGAVGSDVLSERKQYSFLVDAEKMKAGKNVIAISVHQANATSSDLALDLEFEGLETDEEVEQAEQEVREEKESEASPPLGAETLSTEFKASFIVQ